MIRSPVRTTLPTMLLLVTAGCSGANDGEPDTPADDASVGIEHGPVEVLLSDYEFQGLPEAVPAGTRLTVVNESDSELHELVAFHLPDDEHRSIPELAQLPPDELIDSLGEPVTVLLAEPGGPEIPAVGDGTLHRAGRYAVMCFIPTGADPQEYLQAAAQTDHGPPQVAGGPPHFLHGMHAELIVGE